MSAGMIAFVTLIYMATCVSLYFDGKAGLSLAFAGYALANVGLIMELRA